MKALIMIVDYTLSTKLKDLLEDFEVNFRLTMNGYGTADSKFLSLIGLGENKKLIIISLVEESNIKKIYKQLNKQMNLQNAGAGIAFTVAVSSMSGALSRIACQKEACILETESNKQSEYELIITIVDRGDFDTVKKAIKSVGARGGTLVHGLGIGGEEAVKFLGINLQPEKDIILMVVEKQETRKIMNKIVQEAGIKTDSHGICFSLPVESALGLAEKLDEDEIQENNKVSNKSITNNGKN